MPVDMLVSRFLQELERVVPPSAGPFRREGRFDSAVARMRLPPYRPVFHGLCLVEHSRGYRLPSYPVFKRTYLDALARHPRYARAAPALIDDADHVHPGLLHRIGGWYLDGLRHTHLYCALVQAYEEQRRVGVVMMDARIDMKMKVDILIVTPGDAARVSIEAGAGAEQEQLIARRAAAEGTAKLRNRTSSEQKNPLVDQLFTASIAGVDVERSTGVPLFSGDAIDRLIGRLDAHLGVPAELGIAYAQMRGATMAGLNGLDQAGGIPRVVAG